MQRQSLALLIGDKTVARKSKIEERKIALTKRRTLGVSL